MPPLQPQVYRNERAQPRYARRSDSDNRKTQIKVKIHINERYIKCMFHRSVPTIPGKGAGISVLKGGGAIQNRLEKSGQEGAGRFLGVPEGGRLVFPGGGGVARAILRRVVVLRIGVLGYLRSSGVPGCSMVERMNLLG